MRSRPASLSRSLLVAAACATTFAAVAHPGLAQDDVKTAVESSLGEAAAGDWQRPSLWLSSAALDRQLSQSFASTQVGLSITLPHQDVPSPPPAEVRTDNCEDRSCSPTRGCNSDCVGDCTHDVEAFGVKVGTATDWLVCVPACTASKVACETAKKAEHDLCEVNKAIYRGFCGKKLGTFTFSDASADAVVALHNLQLSTDLAQRRANLSGDIGGKARVQGHLHFDPEPAFAALTLCAVFDGWVPPQDAEIQTGGFSFDATLAVERVQPAASQFQVKLGLAPIDVKVEVTHNPILDIIGNNPLNFISCPGLSMVGATVDLFKGSYDFESRVELPQPPPLVVGTIDVDPTLLPGLDAGTPNPTALSFRRSP